MNQLHTRADPVKQARLAAYRAVAAQACCVLVVGLIWLYQSQHAAISAWLGGLAAVLPSLYFARRLFASIYARQLKRILKAFYWGEVIKLLLMATLVIVITRYYEVAMLPFFCGFVVAQMSVWLMPWFMYK